MRADNLGRYRYEQPMARYDKVLTDNDRLSASFFFQDGSEYRDQTGFDAPARWGNMPGTFRRVQNYILSYDKTISPTRIFHAQASYNRFVENFPDLSDPNFTWDKVGIKNIPQVDSFPTRLMPRVSVSGYKELFGNQFLSEGSRQQLNFQANVAEVHSTHSLKYGFEWAQLMRHSRASGRSSGQIGFSDVWSRQYQGVRVDGLDGNGVADLLLGAIGSASITYNDTYLRREPYIGFFVQDDWKITRKLTLNLGLRYDVQFPVYEIHDRLVAGFDFQTPQAFQDAVLANWRQNASTIANYPAAPAAIKGGLQFAGVGGQPRRVYNFDFTNIQPRFGFAYAFMRNTVMRGGFGIFHRTATETSPTTGYSLNTDYVNSVDGGRTPRAGLTGAYSLENPFPDGIVRPPGNSLGIATNVGSSVSFDGRQRLIPRTFQWSYTLERQLPHDMVLEVSYIGSLSNKETRAIDLSDMDQKNYEAAALNPGFYQQTLPNPWYGLLPNNTPLGAAATIQRRDLLRRIPQFNGVTMSTNPWGRIWYHGLQTRFEKRFLGERSKVGALTWVNSYSWSKQMEAVFRQSFNFEWMPMVHQVTAYDRAHNLTFAGVWDLPFGKGRAYLADAGRATQFLVGGWTSDINLTYQTGVPLSSWSRWEFKCGDPLAIQRGESHWFFNDRSRFSECWRQLTTFEQTQLPGVFSQIRSHTAPQLDVMLSKRFNMSERWQLEFRAEAFNFMNTPLRGDPPSTNPSAADFGVLPVQQLNFPRNVQLGMRLRF